MWIKTNLNIMHMCGSEVTLFWVDILSVQGHALHILILVAHHTVPQCTDKVHFLVQSKNTVCANN